MYKSLSYTRDVVRMNIIGDFLLRLVEQGRKGPTVLEQAFSAGKNDWHEGGNETAIGFEASWAGIFPKQE